MEESRFYFRWNRVSQSTGGMPLWPLGPSTTRLGVSQETQGTQRVVVGIALLCYSKRTSRRSANGGEGRHGAKSGGNQAPAFFRWGPWDTLVSPAVNRDDM